MADDPTSQPSATPAGTPAVDPTTGQPSATPAAPVVNDPAKLLAAHEALNQPGNSWQYSGIIHLVIAACDNTFERVH